MDLSIISNKDWILDTNACDDNYRALSFDYILHHKQYFKLANKMNQER